MAALIRHGLSKSWQPFHKFRCIAPSSTSTTTTSFVRYHGNDRHHDSDQQRHHHGGHKLRAQLLAHRGLVQVSGHESTPFLQGLITSDMARFEKKDEPVSLYAGLLNAQGRLLYDLILYSIDSNTYWLECDLKAIDDLIKVLVRHRLRKKIDITNMTEGMNIWTLFRDISKREVDEPSFIDQKFNLVFVPDPRIRSFGWRLVLPEHSRMENIVANVHEQVNEDAYTVERYKIGLAEGVEELPPGKAFPLESNFDFLNGVSFTKGCYVGQELTARTFHTGVTRKRLMPVKFLSPGVQIGDQVVDDKDKKLGSVRAVKDEFGLVLLRIGNLSGHDIRVVSGGREIRAIIAVPAWWPLTDKELKKVSFSLGRSQ